MRICAAIAWAALASVAGTAAIAAAKANVDPDRPDTQAPAAAQQEIAVYALRSLSVEEATTLVQIALSPEGRVSAMPAQGKLVIRDAAENVAAILKLLKEADPEPVNVRVEVTFSGAGQTTDRGLGVEHGGVTIQQRGRHTEIRGGAVVSAQDNRTDRSETTSQSILTLSGSAANIWVGQTVAEPVWTFEYGCSRGWWRQDFVWQELGVSLWVRPVARAGGTIDLEVFPRITARGATPLSVDAKELSTHVQVTPGATVPLGGLTQSQRDVFTRLLGKSEVFNGNSLGITLKATLVDAKGQ